MTFYVGSLLLVLMLFFVHGLVGELNILREQLVIVESLLLLVFRRVGNMDTDTDDYLVVLVLGLGLR